ncbi:hypothetical protein SAMN04487783_0453 [Agrococcus baldri]|uniref:Uncharacterized protein n=1 Tax=Agrococcus baldri TaxID=153730 RepID=A0AA94HKJ0_9MICO|nr:hypothetical protein [Agrococcus baldri]SFS00437.1 hypothetical protein SAMN04487783_0453 [Agrococcus baldri]
MPIEGTRRWAYLGLSAAALFAIGSLVAVTLVSQQREVGAESAGDASSALQERYAAAAQTIETWEADHQQAVCDVAGRIVSAVDIEQRMDAALESAAVVADAWLIINPPPRAAFEIERAATAERFAAGFTTAEDQAVAAQYEGVADVVAACLAEPPTAPPAISAPTQSDVEAIEARAAGLGDASTPDTARLDSLEAAIADFSPALLAAADEVVNVNRLSTTQEPVRTTADSLRSATDPSATIDVLEALTAHANAALGLQAEIEAEDAAQQEQDPAPQPQPAPGPQPAPQPEPTQPEPTDPGDGDVGDSPVDPEVP